MKKLTFALMMLLLVSLISAQISCTREAQAPVIADVQEVAVNYNQVEAPAQETTEPVVVAQAQPTTPVPTPQVQTPPATPEPIIVAEATPPAEAGEDQSYVLHGVWETAGETDYNWARSEFRRGIPDGQIRQFARLHFHPDGTVLGMHGTFRYEAPSRNQANHNNFVNESTFTGTYSLRGNVLTIRGQIAQQEINRSLGDARNARPRSSDETRQVVADETVHLTLNFREAGVISGFSYASGGTSFILPGIVYEKK